MDRLNADRLSLALEVPIRESHAESRGIAPSVCYLRISSSEASDSFLGVVSTALVGAAAPDREAYVQAVNGFVPLVRLERAQRHGAQLLEPLAAVRAGNVLALQSLLSEWQAEALVILFAHPRMATAALMAAARGHPRWWQFSRAGFESAYVKQIPDCDPVVFYSDSHASFEVFGGRSTVWAAVESMGKSLASW